MESWLRSRHASTQSASSAPPAPFHPSPGVTIGPQVDGNWPRRVPGTRSRWTWPRTVTRSRNQRDFDPELLRRLSYGADQSSRESSSEVPDLVSEDDSLERPPIDWSEWGPVYDPDGSHRPQERVSGLLSPGPSITPSPPVGPGSSESALESREISPSPSELEWLEFIGSPGASPTQSHHDRVADLRDPHPPTPVEAQGHLVYIDDMLTLSPTETAFHHLADRYAPEAQLARHTTFFMEWLDDSAPPAS